jgi:casein kinase II subunit beta
MHEKYMLEDFGKCTRHLCNCQRVLPIGLHSEPQQDVAKVFCPKCGEVYSLQTLLDGAYFGPTFPHLFLMTFPDEMPKDRNLHFVPKVFGFKVHASSSAAALAASSSSRARRNNAVTAVSSN